MSNTPVAVTIAVEHIAPQPGTVPVAAVAATVVATAPVDGETEADKIARLALNEFKLLCAENDVEAPSNAEINGILIDAANPRKIVSATADIRNRFFNHFNAESIDYINMLAGEGSERFSQAQMIERFAAGAGKLKLISDRNAINRKMFTDLTPVASGVAAPVVAPTIVTEAAKPVEAVVLTAPPAEVFETAWEEIIKKVDPARMNGQAVRRQKRLADVNIAIDAKEAELAQHLAVFNTTLQRIIDQKNERALLMAAPADADGAAKYRREILKAIDSGAWHNLRAISVNANKWCLLVDTKLPAIWSFQGKPVNFGYFTAILSVEGAAATLKVIPLKENILAGVRDRPFYFLYFNHNGEICWGNFVEAYGRLMQSDSYGDILNALWSLLSVQPSDPTNPYATLDLFAIGTPMTDHKRISLVRSLGLSEYDVLGIPRPLPGAAPTVGVGGIRPLTVTIVE